MENRMQDQRASPAHKLGSRRHAPRYALHLPASSAGAGTSFDVCIRSISAAGLSFETSMDLDIGGRAVIDLPGIDSASVTVIWRGGGLCGCTFDVPITKSVIAATRLKGYPVSGGNAAAAPDVTSVGLAEKTTRWSGTTRVLIAIGAALTAWAMVLGPIAILA